eukprot:12397109-Heterocapsa_arctica.AAC.1
MEDKKVLFVDPVTRSRYQLPKERVLSQKKFRRRNAKLPEIGEDGNRKDVVGEGSEMQAEIQPSPVGGPFRILGDGLFPLSGMPSRPNDESQIGAIVRDRHAAAFGVVAVDGLVAKGNQTAGEKRDKDCFGHVELEPRHDSIFLKGGKDLIRRLIKVRDHQRRVVRKSSEECMSLLVREHKLSVEPAQKQVSHKNKEEGRERAS